MNTRRKVYCAFGAAVGCRVCVWLVFLLCLFAFPNFAQSERARIGICSMDGCNCSTVAHHWIIVKCVFTNDQDVELLEGTIPADAMEVEVSHCRELRIQAGAFTGGPQLKRVHVSGIHSVVAKRQAFQNLSAPNPLLEVSECNTVILESHAFKNVRGPLSISISRCKYVTIKPNAFSWLLWIAVKEVPTLELSSNAFKFEAPPHGRHGPATKIMFQSVKIPELPTAVFPSMVAEVRMDDLSTKIIRKDAFCAMTILSVTISNASIFDVEAGAFSERTFIHSLEFADVRFKSIGPGALRAAVNNLTIQYSRLTEVETGAIDIPAAIVTFNNNEFNNLREKSIVLHQWNHIAIDHNLFDNIESDAIIAEVDATSAPNFEFSFTGNHIISAKPGSLKFAAISQRVNTARVGNNYFKEKCNCNLESWMREITGKNSSASWMMDSSYCEVDSLLGRCFNVPEGTLAMRNFTKLICSEGRRIICEETSSKTEPNVTPPSIGPHVYPRHKGYFDVEMNEDAEQPDRQKRIIVVVCVAVVLFLVLIILMFGVTYMRKQGVWPKLTSGPLACFASWLSPSSGITAATSARSISRLSVHEYAGLQPETRVLEVETQPEIAEEGYAYTENKATQTLPEELTEENLRDLMEKLNDPDNYSQARDMIEHLYDLIKVEESCNNNNNNNNNNGTTNPQEENTYDVIKPRPRLRGPARPSVSIGTRVPSLEKLLPSMVGPKPAIAEYAEPRDNRTNDQNHLYAELPGDETVPSTSRLSQPILTTLAGKMPQLLPPDIVNNVNENVCNQRSTSTKFNSRLDSPKSESCRGQTRPLSFLKALGESILGAAKSPNNKRPNSLLCEYAEPSDATTHLYSELPEPQSSSPPASKMANRPLPTKPDQESRASVAKA